MQVVPAGSDREVNSPFSSTHLLSNGQLVPGAAALLDYQFQVLALALGPACHCQPKQQLHDLLHMLEMLIYAAADMLNKQRATLTSVHCRCSTRISAMP